MKYKVVVIEDDKEFAELQVNTINSLPAFQVKKYYLNPIAFLENENEHLHIDIILLDIIMPEMGGITAIKFILEKYPKASIIINSINYHFVCSCVYSYKKEALIKFQSLKPSVYENLEKLVFIITFLVIIISFILLYKPS